MTLARRRRRWPWVLGGTAVVLFASCWAAVVVVRATAEIRPVTAVAFFAGGPEVLNIAHRGASGYEREHTFAAYDRALAEGADVLELDLRLGAAGEVVVMHDPTARVADPPPLPLSAVLSRYPDTRMNLELKQPDPALVDGVVALIEQFDRADSVVVASFSTAALERFRARTRGEVATSASAGEATRFYLCYRLAIPCRPRYVALQVPPELRAAVRIDLTDPAFIDFAHRHGLQVHYWTIDDPDAMRRLVAAGADGIMTNYPDRVTDVLGGSRPLQ